MGILQSTILENNGVFFKYRILEAILIVNKVVLDYCLFLLHVFFIAIKIAGVDLCYMLVFY